MMNMIVLLISMQGGMGGDTVLTRLPAFPFWAGQVLVSGMQVERVRMVPLDSVPLSEPVRFVAPGHQVVASWTPEVPVAWTQTGDTLRVSLWLRRGMYRYTRVRLIWEGRPAIRAPVSPTGGLNLEQRIYMQVPINPPMERFHEGPTLVILVADSLLPEARVYARLRVLSGEVPVIYTLSWLDQHVFGGDRFYRIRMLLRQLWQRFGRFHVMLVGGPDQIPLGWSRVPGVFPSDPFYETFPTEFGYMFLDGLWDRNGDGLGGELADSVDLIPDVVVGRLPVRTRQEFQHYLEKVEAWLTRPEMTPRLLVLASKLSPYLSGSLYANYALGVVYPRMAPAWMLETSEHTNTRGELAAYLQVGLRGMVTVQHGFESKVAINYSPWVEWSGYAGPDMNNVHPFWMVPVTCDAAAVDLEGFYAGMLRRAGGPVALFGAQRLNFPDISKFAVRWMMQHALADSSLRFGDLALAGLEPLIPYSQYNSVVRYQYLSYSILGDPSLPMWIDTLRPLDLQVQVEPGDPIRVRLGFSDPPRDVYRVVLWRPATGELIRLRTYDTEVAWNFRPGMTPGDTVFVGVWDRGHPVRMDTVVLDTMKPLQLLGYTFTHPGAGTELHVRIAVHPVVGPHRLEGKLSGEGPWTPSTVDQTIQPGDTLTLTFQAPGWNPEHTEVLELMLNGQVAQFTLDPEVMQPQVTLLFAGVQEDTGYLHVELSPEDSVLKVEVDPAETVWTRWVQPGLLRVMWRMPVRSLDEQAVRPQKVLVRLSGDTWEWERALYLPTHHGPLATPEVVHLPGGVRFYLPYSPDSVRGVIVHALRNGRWELLTPYPIEGSRWFDLPIEQPETLVFRALDTGRVVVARSEPVAVVPGPAIQGRIHLPVAPMLAPIPLPTSPWGEPALLVVDRNARLHAWNLQGVRLRGEVDLGTEPRGTPVVVPGRDPGVFWMYWRLPDRVVRVRWDVKGMTPMDTPYPGQSRLLAADMDQDGAPEVYVWTPDGWLIREVEGRADTVGFAEDEINGDPVLLQTDEGAVLVWGTPEGIWGYGRTQGVFPFRMAEPFTATLRFAGPFDPVHAGQDALVATTDTALLWLVVEGDRMEVVNRIPLPDALHGVRYVMIPEGPITDPRIVLATGQAWYSVQLRTGQVEPLGSGDPMFRKNWMGVGWSRGVLLPIRSRTLQAVGMSSFPLLMEQPPLVEPVAMPGPQKGGILFVVQGREVVMLDVDRLPVWGIRGHDLARTRNLGQPYAQGSVGTQAFVARHGVQRLTLPGAVHRMLRLQNPGPTWVRVEVYDRSGRRLRRVRLSPAGAATLRFPRAGMYLIRWMAQDHVITRKVMVLP